MYRLTVDHEIAWDLYNLHYGVFAPLTGFMSGADYRSVVDQCRLASGTVWTLPVTLEIPEDQAAQIRGQREIGLHDAHGRRLAVMHVADVYAIEPEHDMAKIFGTTDGRHPGVARERVRSRYRVGGAITNVDLPARETPHWRTPAETRACFAQRGWTTVTGFQTRNPIHRAHEYLQRTALELTDGLFIQPLVGWKKSGDMSAEAVLSTYETMIATFYPVQKVLLGTLTTAMRYAGPREAVFHALIRKNYGCTHFIIGRDHAGVGNYYGKYEAQEFCKKFPDLGITILDFSGPYFCAACGHVVTEQSCAHGEAYVVHVSGTEVRERFRRGERPPAEYMRPEISDVLLALYQAGKLFIAE